MPTWPADKVERWRIDRLVPYARNARTHSDAQVAQIAASVQEWGWTVPVIVDEQGGLIAGHARVMAAQRLSLTEVPVIVARGWSDTKKSAYILADNKLALNAGWDPELLRLELSDLREMGQDLQVIGFAEDEIAALFSDGRRGLTDPDFVPEPLPTPVTQPGEVWLLGQHRLVCGDCTVPAIVETALAGAKPHLLVSDPPYGVGYDPAWRNRSGMSTSRRIGKVANDDTADWRAAYALFPGDVVYIWHASLRSADFAKSLIASGFDLRAQIIWAKDQLQISRGHYHWQHEPCWFAVRNRAIAFGATQRRTCRPFLIVKPRKERSHGRPTALFAVFT